MTPMTFQKYLTKDSTHAHHQDARPDAAPQFSAFARKCEQLHLNALAAHAFRKLRSLDPDHHAQYQEAFARNSRQIGNLSLACLS